MMILQQGGPPDTSAYYYVAYAWAAVLYAGYAAILWRTRTAGAGAGCARLRAYRRVAGA